MYFTSHPCPAELSLRCIVYIIRRNYRVPNAMRGMFLFYSINSVLNGLRGSTDSVIANKLLEVYLDSVAIIDGGGGSAGGYPDEVIVEELGSCRKYRTFLQFDH